MGKWVHRLSHVDREALTAICAACGPVSLVREARGVYCKPGRMAHNSNRNAKRGEYASLDITTVTGEPKECEVCGTTEARMVRDHCHNTGRFRGWLCYSCNLGLGHFQDNPFLLRLAANYLDR